MYTEIIADASLTHNAHAASKSATLKESDLGIKLRREFSRNRTVKTSPNKGLNSKM